MLRNLLRIVERRIIKKFVLKCREDMLRNLLTFVEGRNIKNLSEKPACAVCSVQCAVCTSTVYISYFTQLWIPALSGN